MATVSPHLEEALRRALAVYDLFHPVGLCNQLSQRIYTLLQFPELPLSMAFQIAASLWKAVLGNEEQFHLLLKYYGHDDMLQNFFAVFGETRASRCHRVSRRLTLIGRFFKTTG